MTAPYLFQRQWKLTLLPRGMAAASVYSSSPQSGSPLQMQFDVQRTLHSTSNKATFRLYNLAPAQRAVFDIGTRIILDCGYGASWQDYASRIYLGDVVKKTIKQEGGDFVCEMECGDSELQLQQCVVQVAFSQKTPLATILNAICSQLNVTIAGQVYDASNKTYQRLPQVEVSRFFHTGPARLALDSLLKGRNIQWSFQNGELIFQANQGIISVVTTDLSKDTGLLERPSLSEQGVTCRALIQAPLEPGAAMSITTSEPNISGNYRIVEAHYKGETYGGDWAVELTGEPLGNLLAAYTKKTSQDDPDAAVDQETDDQDAEAAL